MHTPSLKILIADDHENVRRGLRQILKDGYPFAHIEEAENGAILVTKAKDGDWDIVISDIAMPVMNGLDALKLIKTHLPALPVLMVSIHADDHYAIRALKAGASGYLSKEFAQDELINAVNKVLSGKIYISDILSLRLSTTS